MFKKAKPTFSLAVLGSASVLVLLVFQNCAPSGSSLTKSSSSTSSSQTNNNGGTSTYNPATQTGETGLPTNTPVNTSSSEPSFTEGPANKVFLSEGPVLGPVANGVPAVIFSTNAAGQLVIKVQRELRLGPAPGYTPAWVEVNKVLVSNSSFSGDGAYDLRPEFVAASEVNSCVSAASDCPQRAQRVWTRIDRITLYSGYPVLAYSTCQSGTTLTNTAQAGVTAQMVSVPWSNCSSGSSAFNAWRSL